MLTELHARFLAQKGSLVFSARPLDARRPVGPTRERHAAPRLSLSATVAVARGGLPRRTDGRRDGRSEGARLAFSARQEIKGQSVFVEREKE